MSARGPSIVIPSRASSVKPELRTKRQLAEKLAADVERFLAQGGGVERVRTGEGKEQEIVRKYGRNYAEHQRPYVVRKKR